MIAHWTTLCSKYMFNKCCRAKVPVFQNKTPLKVQSINAEEYSGLQEEVGEKTDLIMSQMLFDWQ